MRTHWFQSPFEHWLKGLLTEIVTLGTFLLFAWGLAVLLMWVV